MRQTTKTRGDQNAMPKVKPKYLAGTRRVLGRSQQEQFPYFTTVCGKEFIVYPNVFSPKYFLDTEFFAEHVNVKEGEDFLEIGPGTGVISVLTALRGARSVTCVDINPSAVANTEANAQLHGVVKNIRVYRGDVFSPLKPNQTFDVILWNTPFGYINNKTLSILERSVFDPTYRSTKKFINGAKRHLKKNGRLLIGFSTTLGNISLLKNLLRTNGFKTKLLAETKSIEIYPVKFQLYQATLT